MSELYYDENSLVDSQMYKYDKFLHSRINKYTGDSRTLVQYFNINDEETTASMGLETMYQVIGMDSPLRYNRIDNMVILGLSQFTPEDNQASQSSVRNYALSGEGYIIPGTIMPKENDFFIVKHVNMNHLFQVTQVTQDGLNTDGSYRIQYTLYTSDLKMIHQLENQVVKNLVMDLQTVGGEDLSPVIGKEDYELRSRLLRMLSDMIENYKARYYDQTHNCFLLHLNGRTLFDLCGNMFMAKHGIMMMDNMSGNIVLNPNKVRSVQMDMWYQQSPYKWIERDAPLRYLETFKYFIKYPEDFMDSSFFLYGTEAEIMVPTVPWCEKPNCEEFFPQEVYDILMKDFDSRTCSYQQCMCCECYCRCKVSYKCKRHDYISLIHDYIHGKITDIHDLSLYIGDPLFNNAPSQDIYLWTPIIIWIIKQTLKIK